MVRRRERRAVHARVAEHPRAPRGTDIVAGKPDGSIGGAVGRVAESGHPIWKCARDHANAEHHRSADCRCRDPSRRRGRCSALARRAVCGARMIGPPTGTRIWIVAGFTSMRKGINGLAALVQTALAEDPFSGQA